MSTLEAIESIQATLEPLEALHGEHTQLETWVHDSFESLENLHSELVQWQSELARKQTELDLREDALDKCQAQEQDLDEQAAQWKHDLEEARQEIQRLEEDNGEQLRELEDLEGRHIQLEVELKAVRQRSEQLEAALEAARSCSTNDQDQWTGEFREFRGLLETQHRLLADHLACEQQNAAATEPSVASEEGMAVDLDTAPQSAELKKRARSRRAAKRRT